MIFDLPSSQRLAHAQDEFKRLAGLSHEEGIRFYKSLSSALFESVFSTLQFYSHRKAVALQRGVSPFIHQLEGPLTRDSKKIVPLHLEASELEKDTALVVMSLDHLVTGEQYPIENLEHLAQQSRIIFIKLIHRRDLVALSLQKEILPYSIEILNLGQGQVVARLGKKCKIHSFFSHLEPAIRFNSEALLGLKSKVGGATADHKSALKRLENHGWEFFPQSRVAPNRNFISHPQLNSEWVLKEIKSRCPQVSADICESTSLCRWEGGSHFYEWWEGRPSDSFLRGGLVFEAGCFDVPGFVDLLIELSSVPQFVL